MFVLCGLPGQFQCGNKRCENQEGLKSWEVNFAYVEHGEKKNALVKLSKLKHTLSFHFLRSLSLKCVCVAVAVAWWRLQSKTQLIIILLQVSYCRKSC